MSPAPAPLVSVVMPAWKATYLAQALESVRRQSHRPLELVVCDDSRDGRIQAMVEAFAAGADFPVIYSRNPARLWETRSTARGIALANGEYVKFLHDDDVLHDGCVAALLDALRRAPQASLASARRRLVDEAGMPLPDALASAFPAGEDLLLDGEDLVDFLADHTLNFIGEPSAVLCRRAPLLAMGDDLPVLGGTRIGWVADLALYVKLLRQGPLAMLGTPQVDFRISRQQFSQLGRDRPGVGEAGHEDFRRSIRALGWYRDGRDTRRVAAAPLDGTRPMQPVDLLHALEQAHATGRRRWPLRDWQARRRLVPAQRELWERHVAGLVPPRLGVLVLPGSPRPDALHRTLASLAAPAGLGAGIRVKALGAGPPAVLPPGAPAPMPAAWDPGAPGASLDAALDGWDVDWAIAVEAGTVFTPGGLPHLLLELAHAPPPLHALYGDEWHHAADGEAAPLLRPDFDLDLLLGHPSAMARHWVFRREALREAGGFSPAPAGACELDLVLRLIERHGTAGIGHLPEPLLDCTPPRPDEAAERAAIARHLRARGYGQATVEPAGPGLHRIAYRHGRWPPVSLVVVAEGALAPLQRCVLSVLEKTAYPDYELLLVDNGLPPEGREWMQQVAGLAGGRVRGFVLDGRVPHAAACNLGAAQARGEYLLFLRDAAAPVQPQWLEALLDQGLRPDVGVVGARTVSADGRITHAGLVPALPGGGRAFLGEPADAPGYMGRLQVAHGCSAVSDACLLVPRELFAGLGGFDHAAFPAGGADTDLCLRARQAGYPTVWTPHALLLHEPPAGDDASARDALCERWLPALAHDPAYHPALRLDVPGGFRLGESDFSWRPLPWRPVPRVLAQPGDAYGSGHYRVMQPFEALRAAGQAEGACYAHLLDVVELARIDPDVVVMQRRVGEGDIALMARMRRHSRAFKVYELDDYLPNLPLKNAHRAAMPRDVVRALRQALSHVDRFVVATPALAEAFAGFHPDIRVARNRLDPRGWTGLPAPPRRNGGRPRVGWAGGSSHTGDLELVADVVRELAGEVDWVFFGLCPERLRAYVAEFHPGVPIERYPRALAMLGLDLALAPLEDNAFNRCKSHLRLLEYGACGYPVVCSDLEPYRGDLPATRVRNRFRDWVGAIRMHLAEREATVAAGQALRQAVLRDWMLAGPGLEEWRSAWMPD